MSGVEELKVQGRGRVEAMHRDPIAVLYLPSYYSLATLRLPTPGTAPHSLRQRPKPDHIAFRRLSCRELGHPTGPPDSREREDAAGARKARRPW